MVCSKLVISLSHTVAVYGQLCLAIGGSTDSDDLRIELQRQRTIACDISMKTKDKLIPLYKNQTSNVSSLSSTSECDLERLCFLFSGCLELLKLELTKSLSLHRLFPSGSTCFINTGISDSMIGTTSRKSVTSVISLTDRFRNDDYHITSIEKDLSCIKTLENDVDRIISVQPWNIEPDTHYIDANKRGTRSGVRCSVWVRIMDAVKRMKRILFSPITRVFAYSSFY
ncbi:hypothetical protein LOTGIDRAFT_165927 [Lottia gigantea]|uniref:Uncharacterized protein n=1 Tax=Lottia gigantea TaxID=225164 RepID=V4BHJ0_LOTGI|nr:hypothetical protein LOTGIDRAFT_165927 [Lottia gigantea]ESO88184.1 hypothetical protein LOTGIDRAFT_165927 [Lottia gigantea]